MLFRSQHVIIIDESNYYAIGNPWVAIPMGAAILACFWATALDMVDIHGVRAIVLPTALVMAAQAVVLAALPYGPLRQWLYYSMRQAFLIGCLLYGFHLYRSSSDTAFRQRMVQHKQLFVTILALTCCILLEDVYVILLALFHHALYLYIFWKTSIFGGLASTYFFPVRF